MLIFFFLICFILFSIILLFLCTSFRYIAFFYSTTQLFSKMSKTSFCLITYGTTFYHIVNPINCTLFLPNHAFYFCFNLLRLYSTSLCIYYFSCFIPMPSHEFYPHPVFLSQLYTFPIQLHIKIFGASVLISPDCHWSHEGITLSTSHQTRTELLL
jgi:hypothetical protein